MIFALIGFGWLLLFLLRVAAFGFPISFLVATLGVPVIPFVLYFVFCTIRSGCVVKFLSVVLWPIKVKVVTFFVKASDPVIYELQYYRNTVYFVASQCRECFGRILIGCYFSYKIKRASIR